MKKRKGKVKFTKYEIVLFLITGIICACYPFMSVYSKSALSEVNYEVESSKKQIATQTKNNESLEMKINELASLDNLEEVAKEMGLSYTSNSIKTIE